MTEPSPVISQTMKDKLDAAYQAAEDKKLTAAMREAIEEDVTVLEQERILLMRLRRGMADDEDIGNLVDFLEGNSHQLTDAAKQRIAKDLRRIYDQKEYNAGTDGPLPHIFP